MKTYLLLGAVCAALAIAPALAVAQASRTTHRARRRLDHHHDQGP